MVFFNKPKKVDADYTIDYKKGTIPIGDLPNGTRVVDLSWKWDFRTEENYSGCGEVKPVTWIIVAKNHYDGLGPHATLLTEELIGRFAFDNSKIEKCTNHWGNSGVDPSATRGLRPWLNSTGIHLGEGFYKAFSKNFKAAVLTTTVPNKECVFGRAYSTSDQVFIPSTTELGDEINDDNNHRYTFPIGSIYPYFTVEDDAARMALLGGKPGWYWTRSPDIVNREFFVRTVNDAGRFYRDSLVSAAYNGKFEVRPVANLKEETLTTKIKK